MEKIEYNNLIVNNELDKLANISILDDLVEYTYQGRYLIEYLLEKGIHTKAMDQKTIYRPNWIKFYLKYHIIKPILNSHLGPLLTTIENETLLDQLLKELNREEKMLLYNNLKLNSYWDFHDNEREIINSYNKHGIKLPTIFIHQYLITDSKIQISKDKELLIKEFFNTFSDLSPTTKSILTHELVRKLQVNYTRTKNDIQKLINYKKTNPKFKITIEKDSEGEYNQDNNELSISISRTGILSHELSHLMYGTIDEIKDICDINEYHRIRKIIDTPKNIEKILAYLRDFHSRYAYMQTVFTEIYYYEIKKKYHSIDEYTQQIYQDLLTNKPDIIMVNSTNKQGFYLNDDNICEVINELLLIEKEEFVVNALRNYYSEELMLENLLDALLMGAIFDDLMLAECLSGHGRFYYLDDEELSFNECLANYDAIKISRKATKLIAILQELVGDDLINLLDYYLEKNRGLKR